MSLRKKTGEPATAQPSSANDQTKRTVESALGQNVMGDFLPSDLFDTVDAQVSGGRLSRMVICRTESGSNCKMLQGN